MFKAGSLPGCFTVRELKAKLGQVEDGTPGSVLGCETSHAIVFVVVACPYGQWRVKKGWQ